MGEGDKPPVAVRFEAVEVRTPGESDGEIVFWCPWCEALHHHGDAGGDGDGHRVAHCVGDRRSPLLQDGVDLVTVARAETTKAALPDALMNARPPLRSILQHFRGEFRALMLQALLGVAASTSRRPDVGRSIRGRLRVRVFGRAGWNVARRHRPDVAGFGFLRLAALLYGVPAGVVAVRVVEEVSAETFDAKTALKIQRAVDEWVERGAPEREPRP